MKSWRFWNRTQRREPGIPSIFRADLKQAVEAEQRYLHTSDGAALDTGAAAWTRVLDHPKFVASDQHFQLAALNDAGGVFLRCYWAAGRIADLTGALELWRQAVAQTLPDLPDLPAKRP